MSARELIESLYDLSGHAIKKFNEYLRSGKIRIVKRVYAKYKVLEFNYSRSGTSFRGTTEFIVKDELDAFTLHELIKELSTENAFRNAVKIITDSYNVNEAQARYWIETFIYRLMYEYHSGRLSNKELTYWINTFINEIEGNPVDWRIEVWLAGVYVETPIELEKGVVLRPPCKEDIEHELSIFAPFGVPGMPFQIPDAILTINKRAKIRPAVYPYKEKLITLLQLYKLCSVHELRTMWAPRGILSSGGTSYPPVARFQTTYKCTINEREAEHISSFIKDLGAKIPIDEEWGRLRVDNSIGVALSQYRDVLLKPEDIPNKIAYAVFGLEALYLKADERGELAQRLAQRVAKVMAKLGKGDGKEVFKAIKRAYKIRSVFVHGEPLKESKYRDRSLLDKLAEYLRTSILIFMQIPIKNELINLIDDALIDKNSDEALERMVKEIRYL